MEPDVLLLLETGHNVELVDMKIELIKGRWNITDQVFDDYEEELLDLH